MIAFMGKQKAWRRNLRAWLYRRLPAGVPRWHLKRRAGFERRWNLETAGFTKEGFFKILQTRLLAGTRPGVWVELQPGDGLVGSLGVWLEKGGKWTVEAWEHREWPARSFRKHRPRTALHTERLTSWKTARKVQNSSGITMRGIREAAGVCRAIREGKIRPLILGVWNPGRKAVWESRLRPCGYRLELVYERMEFYRCRNP